MNKFTFKEIETFLETQRLKCRIYSDTENERKYERWLEEIRMCCSFNEPHESPSATAVSHSPLRGT